MQRFGECHACSQLVHVGARSCPFCGATLEHGSTLALGLGLSLVLGLASEGCDKKDDTKTTQGSATLNTGGQTGTDSDSDSDSATDTTAGDTVITTGGSTSPDGDTTIATSTSTSTSTTFDTFDDEAAAASYAGPDEQDKTDRL